IRQFVRSYASLKSLRIREKFSNTPLMNVSSSSSNTPFTPPIISISAILKDCSRLPCSNLTINFWFMPKIEILQSGWGSSASALILYDSLCFHGVGHLNEPADVSAFQVIDISIIFLTVAHTGFMDIFHDRFQATIYF